MTARFLRVILSLGIIIISSHIEIDLPVTAGGIPFSFQSLAVFICSAFLSPRECFVTLALYLLVGILGLPVFADGGSGYKHILGGSGGFLYGFLFSGLFISYAFLENDGVRLLSVINVMIQATLVLFFFGLIHLAVLYDIIRAFDFGFFPFWKMALVKAVLASLIVWLLKTRLPALKIKV